MVGWRARFGVILPSINVTTESEIYRCLPEGVTAHFTRMEFNDTTPEYLEGMIDDVPAGARMLSHSAVNAILFGCTSGSFYGGLGYDKKIIAKIEEHARVVASTTSTGVIEAFRRLGVGRVAVATPYEDWVNRREKAFFEASGVEVVNIQGLGMRRLVGRVHPEFLYGFAKTQDRKEADALFLSCMGLRTLEIVARLEKDLGKPVLSSNQVSLWTALRMCAIPPSETRCDFGCLLKNQ